MQHSEISLNVADVNVSLMTEPVVQVAGHVDSFLIDGPPEATVNVRFNRENVGVGGYRQVSVGEVFGWSVFEAADGKSLLVERSRGHTLVHFSSEPECAMVDILLGVAESPRGAKGVGPACSKRGSMSPERVLSLVEILPLPVVILLSGRNGLFLHSCAVALAGEGILFSGVSGSGKSTMADLWHRFGPPTSTVVDDEHILARCLGNAPMLYGAPWSRGQQKAIFSRTPAKAIFFLSHSSENRSVRLSSSQALAQLLSQVFLPVWNREQVERTLQTCADLVQSVACYRLDFAPDQRVISFVQEVLGGSL
jgi:hypothetical protein